MALPRIVNFSLAWGDSYEARATVEIGGADVDLNDYEVEFAVKERSSATANLLQHTKSGGDISVNGAITKMFHVVLAPADTMTLTPNKRLYWHAKVTHNTTGAVTTAYRGAVIAVL